MGVQNMLATELSEQVKIHSNDKSTDTAKFALHPNAKEFTLNPNAEEFVFNPNAKVFAFNPNAKEFLFNGSAETFNPELKRTTARLFNAARDGNRELVEALLNAGVDVNLKYNDRLSPLYIAACNGHYEVAIYLVKAGADCNVVGRRNWTPLHFAADYGQIELVKTLVSSGAIVDVRDKNGLNPLYFATKNSHWEVAIYLVKSGADCNVIDRYNKRTPLFFAARDGHTDLVESLVSAGAIVDLKDKNNYSPFFAAYLHSHIDLFICLVKAGAKPYRISSNQLKFKFKDSEKNNLIMKYFLLFNSDLFEQELLHPEVRAVMNLVVCTAQIKELKSTFLGSSNISLFKFLTENDDNKLVNYLMGDGVAEDLVKILTIERFYIFNEMIRNQFMKAQERRLLLLSTDDSISKSNLSILPCEIRMSIYKYLSNFDLVNLKESIEASAKCKKSNVDCKTREVDG